MATAEHCHVCGNSSSLVCESCKLVHYCTDSHLSLDFARHSTACKKYTQSVGLLAELEFSYLQYPYEDYPSTDPTVYPIISNRKLLHRTEMTGQDSYRLCCDAAHLPKYFYASTSVLSALLELNTQPALDKVLVIATDLAYLLNDKHLAAPYFLAVLLKLEEDDLCFKYIRYYHNNQFRQDRESNQPLVDIDDCCYQLPAGRIWSILESLGLGEKPEYPDLSDIFKGVEFDVAYALLYLRLKADLVSLKAFYSVEGFLEERLNYDVKEIIKGFILDTVTIKEALRTGDWKSVASGGYEGAIAEVEGKARRHFFAADRRNVETWKKFGVDWSRASSEGVDIARAEGSTPPVLVQYSCQACGDRKLEHFERCGFTPDFW